MKLLFATDKMYDVYIANIFCGKPDIGVVYPLQSPTFREELGNYILVLYRLFNDPKTHVKHWFTLPHQRRRFHSLEEAMMTTKMENPDLKIGIGKIQTLVARVAQIHEISSYEMGHYLRKAEEWSRK